MPESINNSLSGLDSMRSLRLAQLAQEGAAGRSAGRSQGPAAQTRQDRADIDSYRAAVAAGAQANPAQQAAHEVGTAAAGLGEISGLLRQVKQRVSKRTDSAGSDAEKSADAVQVDSMLAGVDRLAETTEYAGKKLLDGTGVIFAKGRKLEIGSASTAKLGALEADGKAYVLKDVKSGGVAGGSGIAVKIVDTAIAQVGNMQRRINTFEAEMTPRGSLVDLVA